MLLQITDGSVSRQGQTVLSHFQFEIRGTEKIAVVGPNGAGKSTLLALLAGDLGLDVNEKNPDSGMTFARSVTTGMLSQQAIAHPEKTVEEALRDTAGEEWEVDRLFTGFGFQKEDKSKRLAEFSGGEQTKIAFIRLLLSKPDILLLDEPTNHLDFETTQWLEEYLRGYEKAVVIVSHDRYFIDRTAEIIYEISGKKLTRYAGNYSHYRQEKQDNLRRQRKVYERQQEEIARLNQLISRFKHKPNKAAFARSRKKILERMTPVEKPVAESAYLHTGEIQPAHRCSKWVFETEHMKIGYQKPLRELSFRLRRGQKIAVLGANGTGKSTFLKTLAGELSPLAGKISVGNGVEMAYFDQKTAELAEKSSVLDYFREQFPSLTEKEVRNILAGYLFRGRDLGKRVADLSGGEKARLVLARLLQPGPNLLLLDEPTNHMDIPARETMESLFQAYQGTIILVSHDRYFIRQVADALLIFEPEGAVMYYPFGYEHYEQHHNRRKTSEDLSVRRTAEEQALIEGLQAVPRAERHRLREISTESAYRDWRLGILEEAMAQAVSRMEEIHNKMAQEAYFLEEETARRLDTGGKEAETIWTQCCLQWYDEWVQQESED